MRKTVLCILFILCMMPYSINAQKDYYYTYTSFNTGAQLVDGGQTQNARFCRVRSGESIITEYTPYEVKEYGFKDGRVFLAWDIQVENTIRRVFLERLVDGKTKLYFYKGLNYKTFYLEKDSGQLIPLIRGGKHNKESDYRKTLGKLTNDCDLLREPLNLIIYEQKSLASFVDAYNTCKLKEFPYRKYGIMFGYVNTSLLIPYLVDQEFLRDSEIETDGSLTISLFIDYPIGKKGLSFHPEIQYVRNNFDYYRYKINQYWMVINTSCFNIPLMFRYTAPLSSAKIQPYVNAGGQISFLLKEETLVLEDVMQNQVIVSENFYRFSLLADQYGGYIAGAGLQFNIRHRINFFVEFRYAKAYAFLESTLLDKEEYFLLTGINF